MARIQFAVIGQLPDFKQFSKQFPAFTTRILAYIGKRSALALYREHLQGQDITITAHGQSKRGMPLSKKGKWLVSYRVKGNSIVLSSFPLNLFEKDRTWSSGKFAEHDSKRNERGTKTRKHINARTEKGKHILLGKYKSALSGRLQQYVYDAERIILGEDLFETIDFFYR